MNNRKIFVGNLKYTVTEDQLSEFFSEHGEVIDVKVMEGKGYAFVEMGTPDQALRIKNTLSESLFEGRRLLIDSVPSKQNADKKLTKTHPQSRTPGRGTVSGSDSGRREYRSGAAQVSKEPSDSVHHLTDVTEEFKKSPKSDKESGKPALKQKNQSSSDKTEARPDRPSSESRDVRKPVPEQQERERPGNKPVPREMSPKKSGQTAEPGREPEKRTRDQKPKKIKEAPPKNPNPYQGSKKSKKPARQEEDKTHTSPDPEENEKRNYLRYWATISEKRRE